MDSYAYITNPETGRKVNLFGKSGQRIIRNYYIQAGGEVPPQDATSPQTTPFNQPAEEQILLKPAVSSPVKAANQPDEVTTKPVTPTPQTQVSSENLPKAETHKETFYQKTKRKWAEGEPARKAAQLKTQEAISNARQSAVNTWANSQKAMKESWTSFQNKKAWNDEKAKWSNNTNQWNKLTPQERCYLSSLVKDDCAENQYFDKRITEIIQHLVAAHEILKQYHEP